MKITRFEHLKGHTIRQVGLLYPDGLQSDADEIRFTLSSGSQYRLFHKQDCCEQVWIKDIVGDLDDLVGAPLLMADEVSSQDATPKGRETPPGAESYTWTCYKLATVHGYVTIWWYGDSNGYYSESVDFARIDRGDSPTYHRGARIRSYLGQGRSEDWDILEAVAERRMGSGIIASLGQFSPEELLAATAPV